MPQLIKTHLKRLVVCLFIISTPLSAQAANVATAYFAGGCFWCTEADFEKIPGVTMVVSGFMGGTKKNPTYEAVAYGSTRHRETVKVVYDPDQVSYQTLLSAFWRMHDPSDAGGSFVADAEQRRLAEGAVKALSAAKKFDKPIATQIADATAFYLAEGYHQDYYKKNPLKYKYYRYRSGRDQFIEKYWAGDDTVYQTQ
jgi:peptide methionine sulfoxide reductase msrA/msrB